MERSEIIKSLKERRDNLISQLPPGLWSKIQSISTCIDLFENKQPKKHVTDNRRKKQEIIEVVYEHLANVGDMISVYSLSNILTAFTKDQISYSLKKLRRDGRVVSLSPDGQRNKTLLGIHHNIKLKHLA